jgi:hypothetical protein
MDARGAEMDRAAGEFPSIPVAQVLEAHLPITDHKIYFGHHHRLKDYLNTVMRP